MCGRYVSPDTAAIEREWHIGRHNSNPFRRRFNVLPTTTIPIVRHVAEADELELAEARWGFIPQWWKQAKPPSHCFNARSEEAASKAMWREPYRRSRCLIPAEGWFEWRAAERADPKTGEVRAYKQPYFIFQPDRKLVHFAALLSAWQKDSDTSILTCAILTRDAAPSVADVHNRMPVVLPVSAFDRWLDPDIQRSEDVASMIDFAQTDFSHYPVSTRLNSSKTDDEELLRPI